MTPDVTVMEISIFLERSAGGEDEKADDTKQEKKINKFALF